LALNVAVTLRAALMVRVQVSPVPVQSPDQPMNVEPAAAAAVRVISSPGSKTAEHVAPQSMPTGAEVTLPSPVPAREMSMDTSSLSSKVTPTVLSSSMTSSHSPRPAQSMDQPLKDDAKPANALSVTVVPTSKPTAHTPFPSQSTMPSSDVTAPRPAPA
jgi:hypothetical protein